MCVRTKEIFMSATVRTKTGLLNLIYRELDEEQIRELAEDLNDNPLMPIKVQTDGDSETILISLKAAPKELLEEAYNNLFSEDDSDSEEEFDDEESYDEEEVEDDDPEDED